MTAERVLAGLDPDQRTAVTAPAGPVCILAGAGTGKTRAITHRIAYRSLSGEISHRHVLAVTFTARAAAEMRARLSALGATGVPARTFHAAALRQVRYFAPRLLEGRAMPELLESKARLVGLAAARVGRLWSVFRPFDPVDWYAAEGRPRWISTTGVLSLWVVAGLAVAAGGALAASGAACVSLRAASTRVNIRRTPPRRRQPATSSQVSGGYAALFSQLLIHNIRV